MASINRAIITITITLIVKCKLCSAGKTYNFTSCSIIDENSPKKTVYDFQMQNLKTGQPIRLSDYKGKLILLINVATYCSLTHQYLTLSNLQKKYEKDLIVIGYPCNQFALQEPGENAKEIFNALKYIRPGNNFEPDFNLTVKGDVNGENAHPLYQYLKDVCPPTRENFSPQSLLYYSPISSNDIRWNWEKFLINQKGIPYRRYDRLVEPEGIERDIENLIVKSKT